MSVISVSAIKSAASLPPKPKFALFALAFRPFYLLAATFAIASILLWLLFYIHQVRLHNLLPNLAYGYVWHAHEMIFGFGFTVIIGFLFTAGKTWTGLQTPRGWLLGMLCLLWLCARIANLIASQKIALISDAAFELSSLVLFANVIFRAKNKNNYKFLIILTAFVILDASSHLALMGILPVNIMSPIYLGLYLIILVVCIMSSRIIPMFTRNTFPNIGTSNQPIYAQAAIGSYIVAIIAMFLPIPNAIQAGLLIISGAIHALMLFKWRGYKTFSNPLVWILHVSYLWIVLGLWLQAAALFDLTTVSIARHALGVGAMSGMILGMMTRTALGHTGSALQVGKMETIAYIFLHLGAFFRVIMPILLPHVKYSIWMDLAGTFWILAFLLYLIKYTPKLMRARADGKEG